MIDARNEGLGIISAVLMTLGGCLGGGCTRAFGEAALEQQIEAFKQTTEHLVHLAERTDAAYSAEFEYDGEDAEVYLKQSAGLRVPIRIRLGVFGNAKQGVQEHEAGEAMATRVRPAVRDDGGGVASDSCRWLCGDAGGLSANAGAGGGNPDER